MVSTALPVCQGSGMAMCMLMTVEGIEGGVVRWGTCMRERVCGFVGVSVYACMRVCVCACVRVFVYAFLSVLACGSVCISGFALSTEREYEVSLAGLSLYLEVSTCECV